MASSRTRRRECVGDGSSGGKAAQSRHQAVDPSGAFSELGSEAAGPAGEADGGEGRDETGQTESMDVDPEEGSRVKSKVEGDGEASGKVG